MKIDELFNQELIVLNFTARNKTLALKELTKNFARIHPAVSQSALLQALLKREELGSTGIGDGVALPHTNVNQIEHPKVLLAVSKRGIEFNSFDGGLTHFIILIVYPQSFIGRQTQVLSKIARLFREKSLRESLLGAASPEKVLEILKMKDCDHGR
jgi:mannitol/fructose-specific phosphotransferase system IIA component (Ntr-type)